MSFKPGLLVAFKEAWQQVAAERAMAARWAESHFKPVTLIDEARYRLGIAWLARDPDGRLHLIGSAPKQQSAGQTAEPSP